MDLNVTAFRSVQHLTTEEKKENPRSVAGRVAGKVGGVARAEKLTPQRRKAIAVEANKARWNRKSKV